jgi:hypothetical protein
MFLTPTTKVDQVKFVKPVVAEEMTEEKPKIVEIKSLVQTIKEIRCSFVRSSRSEPN